MSEPITLFEETTPSWFNPIIPKETPQERYRRIEREMKELEKLEKQVRAECLARVEAIHDRQLNLMDQRIKVLNELEAMGEEV